jgi:hypothetical protein
LNRRPGQNSSQKRGGMADRRVICINKQPSHDDTHHHITHVGIGTTDKTYSERIPVSTVITNIKSPFGDRYHVNGSNGVRSEVIVKQCPQCAHAHEIISTTPDRTKTDNLLSLLECQV